MVRIFAPICLLVSLCGTAYAAQPLALILSWGQDSCGKYVQAEKQEKQMYLSWVLGFISGANTRDTGAGRMGGTDGMKPVLLPGFKTIAPRTR